MIIDKLDIVEELENHTDFKSLGDGEMIEFIDRSKFYEVAEALVNKFKETDVTFDMTREDAKKMAMSRDCHCIKGVDRDNNYKECIDKIFDFLERKLGQEKPVVCPKCLGDQIIIKEDSYECAYSDCQHKWIKNYG